MQSWLSLGISHCLQLNAQETLKVSSCRLSHSARDREIVIQKNMEKLW
jgi:hypothetical protein